MKVSKKCPLCHLSPAFHRELLRKRMLLGSVAKAYAWFQRERPSPEITEYKFQAHFRRHVTDEDYDEIKLSPKNPLVKASDIAPVLLEKKGVAVNPQVELASLYIATVKQMQDLAKLAQDDLDACSLLLKFIGECRKQIQLLHSMRPSLSKQSETVSDEEISRNSGDEASIYAMMIESGEPEEE
ncbi:MAG: hypothetical protein ACXQS8_06920 [Candidatus Helarchaeales archaeon]